MGSFSERTVMNLYTVGTSIAQEHDIVAEARAGSSMAFAELYATYSRRIYKTILAITKDCDDAEDALQETFLRAYLAIHAFEERSTVYSWLTRIAINSALLLLRKRRSRNEICLDLEAGGQGEAVCLEIRDLGPNPEELCDLGQRRMAILRAVRRLDDGMREPIQMRLEKEASLKEISEALKISEGAVKARLHRARLRLSAVCAGAA
jgi:RNA polymerase sigma-70 factor, ECF subfamily